MQTGARWLRCDFVSVGYRRWRSALAKDAHSGGCWNGRGWNRRLRFVVGDEHRSCFRFDFPIFLQNKLGVVEWKQEKSVVGVVKDENEQR
ncbi:hypothetical protein RYX36_004382 [Vicia faba]